MATKYTDRYRLLVTGILIALVACGGTARPHDAVSVATDAALPIPTAAPTNTPPPLPGYAPAPVEKAGSGTACPDGYPIKADDDTKLYHRPGQREYDVTNARHCFVSERTAQAAGYQASREPILAGERQVVATASIGIAVWVDGADADALLREADLALYRAKARGKGRATRMAHDRAGQWATRKGAHAMLVTRVGCSAASSSATVPS